MEIEGEKMKNTKYNIMLVTSLHKQIDYTGLGRVYWLI